MCKEKALLKRGKRKNDDKLERNLRQHEMVAALLNAFVFNHGCASTVNSVLASFNFIGWTSWTWTSTTTQVTITVTGTLPAAMELLAVDVKYIP